MYRSPRFLPALATVALAALVGACGSDDSNDSAALPAAACDAYSTIGAAMFGDPSGVPDASVTLAAEAPEELRDAAATYGNTFTAAFDGDEAAMESPEFAAAAEQLGAAAYETCDSVEQLDVSGIDYGFEGLPDRGRRRPRRHPLHQRHRRGRTARARADEEGRRGHRDRRRAPGAPGGRS